MNLIKIILLHIILFQLKINLNALIFCYGFVNYYY